MNLRETLYQIESHEFAAYVNVASSLKTFLYAISDHDATRTLWKALDSPESQEEVLVRVFELCRQVVDPRYANPWDTALAVYVWLLNSKDPRIAKVAAEKIIHLPRCWWASRLAQDVLLEREIWNPAGFTSHNTLEPAAPTTPVVNQNTVNTGDCLVTVGFVSNLGDLYDDTTELPIIMSRHKILSRIPLNTGLYSWSTDPDYTGGLSFLVKTEDAEDSIIVDTTYD